MFEQLQKNISGENKIIWMHCASAGEFEQGKPILEKLKECYSTYKILVTFFSPSGIKAANNYPIDYISYMPLDTHSNAERFLKIVNPKLVIFIKYEYWYHHLKTIHKNNIPLILVSAIFRKDQPFFKWYGSFYRRMLYFFKSIFVQDEQSCKNLNKIKINHCHLAGDTRFDRVAVIAKNIDHVPYIKEFIGQEKVFIAGSTWTEDEDVMKKLDASLKLIIVPHELDPRHLKELRNKFSNSVSYSKLNINTDFNARVLIIDNIGKLSRIYKYATITYIGGGFNKSGIHNTLEAAVYGKPVVFGPHYKKFKEARDLVAKKAAFSISNESELKYIVNKLLTNDELLKQTGDAAKNYVQQNTGATEKIMSYIQENRLLTN
jgi:3-deoxy-D-manno-octulosonic-acid transferase